MSLPSIDLNVAQKLKRDPEFRHRFFLAEASAQIARQLIALRKRRDLSQLKLAEKLGTQQSAISRVESADYRNWSFNTLWKLTKALDGRLRVVIEPTEEAILEYEKREADEASPLAGAAAAAKAAALQASIASEGINLYRPVDARVGAQISQEQNIKQ